MVFMIGDEARGHKKVKSVTGKIIKIKKMFYLFLFLPFGVAVILNF